MLRYCDDLMTFPGSVLGDFRLGGPGEYTGHFNSRLCNECMAAEAFPPVPLIPFRVRARAKSLLFRFLLGISLIFGALLIILKLNLHGRQKEANAADQIQHCR
jgi:hypothetical protein